MSRYSAYKDLGNNSDLNNPSSFNCEVITTAEQKQNILKNNKLVLIDIYGDWCNPCKMISPVFEKMAEQYNNPGQVYLCKEDVDKELSPHCTGVPMFAFFVNGTNVKNIMGGDMKQVEESLQALITARNSNFVTL